VKGGGYNITSNSTHTFITSSKSKIQNMCLMSGSGTYQWTLGSIMANKRIGMKSTTAVHIRHTLRNHTVSTNTQME
jgi:hypothetical protein